MTAPTPPHAPPGAAVEPRGDVSSSAFAEGPQPEPHSPRPRGRHARPDRLPQPLDAHTADRSHLAAGDAEVDARVAAMLAQLAAEPRTPIDGMLRRFEDPTTRVALMVGGTVALMLVLFAGYFVVGLLLG